MKKIKTIVTIAIVILAISCKKASSKIISDTRPRDIDGNVYDTVVIGTQTWMVQNLKTTKYNDGTSIPTDLDDVAWANINIGAFTVYNANNTFNTTYYNDTYGKLYNWYAVNTGKLAPKGWHIPTDAECTTLTDYLGGENTAGGAMKATTLWNSPNTGANNSSGFTCLPAGRRDITGSFNDLGNFGNFWSSTGLDRNNAWSRRMYFSSTDVSKYGTIKQTGLSVRCVRD
ncbi:MAG: FISUMP domain-containing protein [Chitinophagales bacterium]